MPIFNSMFTITKRFRFEASHRLAGLPESHPCSRLHGHSYKVYFLLQSKTLNGVGFVRDFRDLTIIQEWLNANFDHRHLNDVLEVNPTAENIAQFLFEAFIHKFPELVAVTVEETENASANYYLS